MTSRVGLKSIPIDFIIFDELDEAPQSAVQSDDQSSPSFTTVAEVEAYNVETMLERTWEPYLRYGANCTTIPWVWYGDPESSLSFFLARFMGKLRTTGEDRPFYLIYPPQHREPDAFNSYCRTIYSLVRPERKRLVLGECRRLRAHLTELGNLALVGGRVEDNQAVSALGYVLSALVTYEPWMMEISGPDRGIEEQADTDNPWGGYY